MPDLDRKSLRLVISTIFFIGSVFTFYIFKSTQWLISGIAGDDSKEVALNLFFLGIICISIFFMLLQLRILARDLKKTMTKEKRPALDVLVGILLIMSGIIVIFTHFEVLNIFSLRYLIYNQYLVCSVMSIIFGLVAFISGVYFVFWDDWFIPALGGICAVLSFIYPSMALGGIALLIFYISSQKSR